MNCLEKLNAKCHKCLATNDSLLNCLFEHIAYPQSKQLKFPYIVWFSFKRTNSYPLKQHSHSQTHEQWIKNTSIIESNVNENENKKGHTKNATGKKTGLRGWWGMRQRNDNTILLYSNFSSCMFETPFVESKCINIIYGMAVLDIFFTEIHNNDSWFQFKARNGLRFWLRTINAENSYHVHFKSFY